MAEVVAGYEVVERGATKICISLCMTLFPDTGSTSEAKLLALLVVCLWFGIIYQGSLRCDPTKFVPRFDEDQ